MINLYINIRNFSFILQTIKDLEKISKKQNEKRVFSSFPILSIAPIEDPFVMLFEQSHPIEQEEKCKTTAKITSQLPHTFKNFTFFIINDLLVFYFQYKVRLRQNLG